MVIRFDTRCPNCNKENCVFGRDIVCKDCQIRGFFKSQIKAKLRVREQSKIIRAMKEEIRSKLHDDLLKEILEEQK